MTQLLQLGAPGAGKGTQGALLADFYQVPHISTGEMLRDNVARGTELGDKVRPYLERGQLVPDELVFELVVRRLTEPVRVEGFVLDGFPRTLEQAVRAREWGEQNGYRFSAVVHLQVPREELIERLLRRRKEEGRSDDTLATVMGRLEDYAAVTAPLLDFYRGRGILVEVDGTGVIPEVASRIVVALATRGIVPPTP